MPRPQPKPPQLPSRALAPTYRLCQASKGHPEPSFPLRAEPPMHALRDGRRRRQAEKESDLRAAARDGDLATLTRLVDQGVDINAASAVSRRPAPSPQTTSAPRPSAPRRPDITPASPLYLP